jgi:hypothetical protein
MSERQRATEPDSTAMSERQRATEPDSTVMMFDEAVRLVLTARTPADLFAAHTFRQLARAVHPDRVEPGRRATATRAFTRLAALWREHRGYGFGPLAYSGELANLYEADSGHLKLIRNPANNDLMDRETRALTVIATEGDPRYLPYVPRLVSSFRHRDPATGAERRANIVEAGATGLHSLVEVRSRYPDGVDPRDAAWMWRRLLVALGLAHHAGVVHGAVLPEHVLIQPADHGVVLVDWCYSAIGDRIPAIVAARRDWYPREVLDRLSPGPGTDIAMAAGCLRYLMADRAPGPLLDFADGCAQPALRNRPDNAWRLLREFDGLLERLYGPRKFRPFSL